MLVEVGTLGLRYRMLETVREYARKKLEYSGEWVATRQRHRDWYLQFAEQSHAVAHGGANRGTDETTLFAHLEGCDSLVR
ncbi:MAG: hypothetical protein ACRDRO_10025 [Pseudonocardiaceae bacterium]